MNKINEISEFKWTNRISHLLAPNRINFRSWNRSPNTWLNRWAIWKTIDEKWSNPVSFLFSLLLLCSLNKKKNFVYVKYPNQSVSNLLIIYLFFVYSHQLSDFHHHAPALTARSRVCVFRARAPTFIAPCRLTSLQL